MGFQTWRSTLKCMAHVYYGLVNDLGHFFKLKIWKRWKFHFICGSIIFQDSIYHPFFENVEEGDSRGQK
jgi:hypothetical protein